MRGQLGLSVLKRCEATGRGLIVGVFACIDGLEPSVQFRDGQLAAFRGRIRSAARARLVPGAAAADHLSGGEGEQGRFDGLLLGSHVDGGISELVHVRVEIRVVNRPEGWHGGTVGRRVGGARS